MRARQAILNTDRICLANLGWGFVGYTSLSLLLMGICITDSHTSQIHRFTQRSSGVQRLHVSSFLFSSVELHS
jgi:hypothetical protein